MKKVWLVLLAGLSVWLVQGLARADAPDAACASPRSAVDSVFAWQQPRHTDLARASACLDLGGTSLGGAEEARRIKSVYDSRALYVDMSRLSDDPHWVDPQSGLPSVAPHPSLEHVRVVRQSDGAWRWTPESLSVIDDLYEAQHGLLERVVGQLPSSFQTKVLGVHIWQYLALLLLGVVALVLRKLLEYVVARNVRELSERWGKASAAHLVNTVASPGATLAAGALLRITYPELDLPIGAARVVAFVVRVLVIGSVIWALYRLVDVVAATLATRAAATESKLDDQLVPLLRKSLKIVVVVGGSLFLLQNLDIDVGSLLAGLGIGGLAFALAAKDTLANFFGSIMIFADRPFQVGDWVAVKGIEGIVEEVGFRSTRIRTFYNSQVSVPNAAFTEAQIDNYGRRQYRRTYVTLNLTYDTTPEQMQAFVEGIRAILVANPYTRKDYYEVHMAGFGASSLDVMVYFFFEVPSWSLEMRERHNVFLEIMRLARALGVSFAFPTQTLHVAALPRPGEMPVAPKPPAAPELAATVRAFGPQGAESRPKGPKIVPGAFTASPELASYPPDAPKPARTG